VLINQASSRRFETVLRDVRERVTSGDSLADALSNHPRAFNALYVNMVRAGEASGHLDAVLGRVGEYLVRQNRLRNKVSSALLYPVIMITVGSLVVVVLMKFVVPRILALVSARGGVLPLPTRMLKATSDFFNDYWMLLVIAVFGIGFAYSTIYKSEKGRYAIDRIKLRLPIFGDLYRKQAISRFSVTLATLLRSGVPVLEALKIVQNVVDNAVMSEIIGDIHDRIVEGQDISTPLKKSKMFPPVVGHMIAVGEQSGQLEDILGQLSEAYDEEIDISTQRMTAILEPIMIICIAVVVAFIVLAIVLPMLRLGKFV
jgi:general secretion pathway protein F